MLPAELCAMVIMLCMLVRDEAHRKQLAAQSAQSRKGPTPNRGASAPVRRADSLPASPSTGGKSSDKAAKKRRSTEGKRGLFRRKSSSASVEAPVETDGDHKPMGTFLTKYFGEVGVDQATGGDEVQKALAK